MSPIIRRFRSAAVAGVAAATAAVGLGALTLPARATSSFTMSRLAGADRFDTAGKIDQAAFPNGATGNTALLGDGLSAHAPDALAASGLAGVDGVGVLLTDNTNTVPASTLSALSNNKVQYIAVLGGTASVSSAQITYLQQHGYSVVAPFQGSTRYQTMKMIDESIKPSQVGTDASGNPTAILASGDSAHYVDALSAGALAYAKKFPIILTNSGTTLQPEAQQVITALGIKHLIVAGGSGSIPTSQYNPKPSGVTQVDVEYGADRSATSTQLADFAIGNGWLKNTNLDLARGDDGADALAGAAFGGVNGFPTILTKSTSDIGSATSFASEHASTLSGTSYIFGGTDAVTASQQQAVTSAAGAAAPAQPGAIAPTSTQTVNSVSTTSFTQSGLSYTFGPNDTYQLLTPGSTSSSCKASTYSVFTAALSQGDQVTGTYAPSSTSTFCLNDQAPNPPSDATATANTTAGGVTVSWSAPSTAGSDGVTGYQLWRATATPNPASSQFPETCPAAYSNAPGKSPQAVPTNYTALALVPNSAATSGKFTYNDATASQDPSGQTQYCYAVSAVDHNAAGTTQTGTAAPASPGSLQASSPTPVAPGVVTPSITSVSAQGHSIFVTYNEPVNASTLDGDGSDYAIPSSEITYSPGAPTTKTAFVSSAGNQVTVDIDFGTVNVGSFDLTPQNGADGNGVCASGSTTLCSGGPGTAVTGTSSAVPTGTSAPAITGASGSASGQTVTVNYNQAIDCATVDSSGKQYTVTEAGNKLSVSKAACSGSGPTSSSVVLSVTGLVVGASFTVVYNPMGTGSTYASNHGIVTSGTSTNPLGTGEAYPDPSSGSGVSGSVGS